MNIVAYITMGLRALGLLASNPALGGGGMKGEKIRRLSDMFADLIGDLDERRQVTAEKLRIFAEEIHRMAEAGQEPAERDWTHFDDMVADARDRIRRNLERLKAEKAEDDRLRKETEERLERERQEEEAAKKAAAEEQAREEAERAAREAAEAEEAARKKAEEDAAAEAARLEEEERLRQESIQTAEELAENVEDSDPEEEEEEDEEVDTDLPDETPPKTTRSRKKK